MIGVALVLTSLLSVSAQLCQKQATRPSAAGGRSRHLILWLGLALICMGAAMVLWLLVLQTLPVGIAYPMLSLNFVWITLAAWKIWYEQISTRHWFGVALIISGIIILGSTA